MLKVYTIMFGLSVVLVGISIALLFTYGLNLGVDFRGGSVMEIAFYPSAGEERPSLDTVRNVLTESGLGEITVNYTEESSMILRTKELSETEHQAVVAVLKNKFDSVEEKRFDSIGPVIGNELKRKSVTAMLLVLAAVIIYIAAVFRKLSKTLSSWTMGLAAIAALLHDVIIPLGVFAILGRFYGVEISAVFVAAVLTILGYSVADTVVVFDRVRENIIRGSMPGEGPRLGGVSVGSFPGVVHKSILQTLTRSLNTTFTTLFSLFAIYFFGGESIRYFALALMIGIFLGAYSSIFVASPLLVWWSRAK